MNIRAMLLPALAGLLAISSSCETRQAAGHADVPPSRAASSTNSLVNASEVFADIGMSNVTNAVLMAWRPDYEQVVVTGKRGEKYIAAIASRAWFVHGYPWKVLYRQVMTNEGVCLWYHAKDEYDHSPTRNDIALLFRRVRAPEDIHRFVFQETAK